MRFRFTLTSDSLGSETLVRTPVGWDTMEILIKRGADTHGFFYEQLVNLSFYCGAGKEYIDQVRSIEGIDANIGINIEVVCGDCSDGADAPDYSIDYSDDYGSTVDGNCIWETIYEGILDMRTWESSKNFTNVNIIESSFFQKVRNRMDTVVDLLSTETLDGTTLTPFTYGPYDLNLHSKAILAVGEVEMLLPSYSEDYTPIPSNDTLYVTLPIDSVITQEFSTFNTPVPPLITSIQGTPNIQSIYYNDSLDPVDIDFDYELIGTIIEFLNRDRTYNLSITYNITNTGDPTVGGITFFDYGAKAPLASTNMTQAVNLTGTLSVTIPSGYSFCIYLVLANYDNDLVSPSLSTIGFTFSSMRFTGTITSLTDASIGKAFARFEAGARIAQVISDSTDAFRSTYLGRTNSQPYAYDSNGCGSFAALLSGFWARGYPITGEFARTTKMSLTDYFKSNSAIDNLGMGIELIDGEYYIVMERMDHFYDVSTTLLTFNNVPDILIQEAKEYYFARVNVGYNKWTTEFRNGLEEPNSKRFFDLGIKAVDSSKEIYSNFVAGGYPLEDARRQQFSDTVTSDTEYDEDNFIVCLNRTVDGSDIPTMLDVAEKDENFTQVNNLLSPETSYNLRITPYRNYLRHNDIINPTLLKYAGRNVKFMGGEGNYKMESELTDDSCPGRWNNNLLSEGQNIQWDSTDNTDNNPIWVPEVATFRYPISYTDFKVLKNNPKGVIQVSETDENHIPYFILDVTYIPANGGLADFKLLRAYQA